MTSLEKNLYKRVKVNSPARKEKPGRAYRGFSTVANEKEFTLYDFELIKQDIINHFHIRQGEKLSDPSFGTIIWDLLFEPFTDDVRDAIVENVREIINYDPRVQPSDVFVDTYEHGIVIKCSLLFLPYNLSDQLIFEFDQRSLNNI
jgi:phage baseplate assembly protein W